MRGILAGLLILSLLCTAAALSETDLEAVQALYAAVQEDRLPILSGEPAAAGRLLIAVWEYGENVPHLSSDEADADGYHGIPADRLASGLADAQKAYDLLLKAASTEDEAERAKAIEALEGMRGSLSEAAQKQLDALTSPDEEAEQTETDEQNKP